MKKAFSTIQAYDGGAKKKMVFRICKECYDAFKHNQCQPSHLKCFECLMTCRKNCRHVETIKINKQGVKI